VVAQTRLANMMVTALGQGPAGLKFEDIAKTDEGTSFSTPFVAAATWVKYLLDWNGGGPDAEDTDSSKSVSNESKRPNIESVGALDAPRLLLDDHAFVMLDDRYPPERDRL